MKTTKAIIKGVILGFAAIAIAAALSSCVTSEIVTTAPDGTVTRTSIKATDAASINAASNMAGVVSGLIVRAEK